VDSLVSTAAEWQEEYINAAMAMTIEIECDHDRSFTVVRCRRFEVLDGQLGFVTMRARWKVVVHSILDIALKIAFKSMAGSTSPPVAGEVKTLSFRLLPNPEPLC
jgi:hypothetical protein